MAKKKKTNAKTKLTDKVKAQIEGEKYLTSYNSDFEAMSSIRDDFEEREKILLGVQTEDTKDDRNANVVDPTLQTAIIKQTNQLVTNLPTGQVKPISKGNVGEAFLMNLILHKYVIPNALSQYDVFTKIWLMSLYTKVYGSFGVMVDYVVKDDYVGPDFTLIPARAIVFQPGKYTIEDSDYVWVRSTVSREWLKERDKSIWKNTDYVLEETDTLTPSTTDYSTYSEEKYSTSSTDDIELITKYTKDKWITFSSNGYIVREIKNPHGNNIPVIMNYSYPLLDRIFGLGEIERGTALHKMQNELINLHLDAIKTSIAPPVKIDLSGVVPRTIVNKPGAKWIIRNGAMNAVQEMQRSPLGLSTFQSTYGFLKGAILSLTNTTDTSVSKTVDPGMGKTPQALKMQMAMEDVKTSFDIRMLESTITKIYDRMIELIVIKQKKPIKFYLLDDEINALLKEYPKLAKHVNKKSGKIIIKPDSFKDIDYKFIIDHTSTVRKDQAMQHQAINDLMDKLLKLPTVSKQIEETGEALLGDKKLVFSELVSSFVKTANLDDTDKLLVDNDKKAEQQNIVKQHQKEQGIQGMIQSGAMPGMAPQGGVPMPPQQVVPQPQMAPQQPMPPQMPQSPVANLENDPQLAAIINQLGGR